jgi:hypothetical protein
MKQAINRKPRRVLFEVQYIQDQDNTCHIPCTNQCMRTSRMLRNKHLWQTTLTEWACPGLRVRS